MAVILAGSRPSVSGRIVVVGSSNTDLIVKTRSLPRPGETVIGGQFMIAAGGKGANQAVASARAGGAVTFIGRFGTDENGAAAVRNLVRDGIDTRAVVLDAEAPSGVALILVAEDGENSIAVASGANDRLSAADVRRAKHAFAGAKIALAQLETPLSAIAAAFRQAKRSGMLTILNPAPARSLPAALLRDVSILTPNEVEASTLSGVEITNEKSAAAAANRLLRCGVKTVIITLGAHGAYVANGQEGRLVPGFRVKAVDTTAAGDVFNGALAVALAEAKPLLAAVQFAQAAAAISVTRMGAQPSAPHRREIEAMMKRYGKRSPR